ncbi:DUF3710 domain-containing protein [Leucobacter aridicollis]|uniref:DUF3710 domain-containing protein n=1 Tax=Leucobacter aridicollis TaxID=283878 RepID=UPI000E64BD93|nr:DUF3710 domain-containing protein [Leucobacter aridicollis]UTX54598.1 DUF3710 domain-containing protein [Leucobacter aridicollis]
MNENDTSEVTESAEADVVDTTKSAPADRETAGPFDFSEVPTMRPYVDLGGIKIAPREGLQMRLEVDERAKRVVAVSLEYADSLLQVQAFSAPKTSGMWNQIRRDLTSQLTAQGAKVTEEEGALGAELVTATPVPADQGGGTRAARFIGVDGPRWVLRGILMGKAAVDTEARASVVELFREIVVVRGDLPMPPGDLLPLKVPAGVQPGAPGAGAVDA